MTLQEFMKEKTGINDVIGVRGLYFEADRFKKYVKACKELMNVDVIFNQYDNMLEIDYISGKARFLPVNIDTFTDSDNVTWFKPVNGTEFKVKTGKAWELSL